MSDIAPDQSHTEVVAEAAVVSDGTATLFIADFTDTDTAWEAYEAIEVHRGRPPLIRALADEVEKG